MARDNTRPVEIFYSFASTEDGRDEELQQQLEKHLGILKRQGKIANRHKRNILAGQVPSKEISKHLNSAQIILLLITPDFVSSDQCWDVEMDRALERQKEEKTLVIPVLLRPLDYSKEAPFSSLRVLPKNGKPVTSWSNQDEAFEDIAYNIRLLIEKFEQTQRISWKNIGAGISFAVAISTLVTGSTATPSQVQSSRPRTEIRAKIGHRRKSSRKVTELLPVQNASFEDWQGDRPSQWNCTSGIRPVSGINGSKALEVSGNADNQDVLFCRTLETQEIPVEPASKVKLSFWAKKTQEGRNPNRAKYVEFFYCDFGRWKWMFGQDVTDDT